MQHEIDESFGERLWILRRPAQLLLDLFVLTAAFLFAYLPAVNIQLGDYYLETALSQLPFVILVEFAALFVVGAYSIIWRYISIEDIRVFLKAAIICAIVFLSLRFLLIYSPFRLWQIPISVILLNLVLGFGGLLAVRVLRRFSYELGEKNRFAGRPRRTKLTPALIVGAGRMGATLVKEIYGRRDAELEIRGFVDDDSRKVGGSVGGVKVLGRTRDLAHLVEELHIKQVVIAIDNARGAEIRRVLDLCSGLAVKTQIVPSLDEIATGRVSVSRTRDVQIEDLLGRDPVELDDENLHHFLTGKTVMVTGAGGSIGSELVRQITKYQPKRLLLVERAEFLLFQIERELANKFEGVVYFPLIADAGDDARMREIFERFRPEVIFHAAAHKHVPMMEANPCEAVKNNIFATRTVATLAGEFCAESFVLISTDKAVNPTSVMGASKRVAELVVQSLDQRFERTNYIAVRFGNVLGSAGSVVPIFREQILAGGPVTVTDREMTRYFMTIPEASQLVLQAGALGEGGEIFILDMGKPVRILDLAEDMIRLSGLTPYEDIDIQFSGIRKGEKLFEELEISGESLLKTKHPKIFIGKIATYSTAQVDAIIAEFQAAVRSADERQIRQTFNTYLPEATIAVDHSPQITAAADPDDNLLEPAARLGLAEK
ncbi:MAG: polysaccharide biosynthesis protein [Pyrinomonadaceae bacterium]